MSNSPSFRFPFSFPEGTPAAVEQSIRYAFNGLTNHEQAFVQLKQQISELTASTTALQNAPAVVIPTTTSWPDLGTINNQTGQTSYTTQTADNGALLVLNDASPIAVSLNSVVKTPYFLFAVNAGVGTATFTPTSGTISYPLNAAAVSMPLLTGCMAIIFWDGTNWWAATTNSSVLSVNGTVVQNPNFNDSTPAATAGYVLLKWQSAATNVSVEVPYGSSSVFGVVKVDNTTITAAAGVISAVIPAAVNFADSETPSGVIDGANKTFTLANAPNPALSLQLFLQPMGFFATLEIQGVDYTLSGLTITTTIAPSVGQVLRAWYRH